MARSDVDVEELEIWRFWTETLPECLRSREAKDEKLIE